MGPRKASERLEELVDDFAFEQGIVAEDAPALGVLGGYVEVGALAEGVAGVGADGAADVFGGVALAFDENLHADFIEGGVGGAGDGDADDAAVRVDGVFEGGVEAGLVGLPGLDEVRAEVGLGDDDAEAVVLAVDGVAEVGEELRDFCQR